jgi:hypothetical protein
MWLRHIHSSTGATHERHGPSKNELRLIRERVEARLKGPDELARVCRDRRKRRAHERAFGKSVGKDRNRDHDYGQEL